MTGECQTTRSALSAYIDGELPPSDATAVADHLASCAQCSTEYQAMLETVALVRGGLVRYRAPDVLRARIRAAVAATPTELDGTSTPTARGRSGSRWWARPAMVAATAVFAVALGSGVTLLAVDHGTEQHPIAAQVLASHLRSLMPDHLTDIRSSDQHNVKPWFNGRVDYSPNVPRFEDQGYPLIGGRVDYVGDRAVAVVVYGRRQHLINVFSWPSAGGDEALEKRSVNGYQMLRWRSNGIEKWVVSDLNAAELTGFARLIQAADSTAH